MSLVVPSPIATYFSASNAHDPDAAVACFAPAAQVVDEGETHVGPAAIRAWLVKVYAKYAVTATVTSVTPKGDGHRVAAQVAGNFPGSPATLHYDFSLVDGAITRLSIG